MSARQLHGMPQFLRFVSTYPAPEPLARALWRGPLGSLGARAGSIWRLHAGRELVAVATYGHTRDERARYALIPMNLDFDIARAIDERQTVVSPADSFGENRIRAIDAEFWLELTTRLGGVALVSAPIVHGGDVVGGLGLLADRPWTADAQAVLDAVTATVGLWMTHPLVGLDLDAEPTAEQREWAITLTERQADILRRIEAGQPAHLIAVDLRISDSTVRADVQNAMRVLRTSDRHVAVERARALGLL
jgi:DNA-binding CsgD family transcriptional regulator